MVRGRTALRPAIPGVEEFDAWVVYLDVFGFSAYVSEDVETVVSNLHSGHEFLSTRFQTRRERVHVRVISDSVFIIYRTRDSDDASRVLHECYEDLQDLLREFVELRLPLRGGMAFGKVYISDTLLLGEVVVRAVRTESMIEAPFVVLPKNEMSVLKGTGNVPGRMAQVPVKDGGLVSGVLIRPHPYDQLLRFAKESASRHLEKGPPPLARKWVDALRYMEADERE
jgi:hypothetical protein